MEAQTTKVSKQAIGELLRRNGIEGRAVCLHSAYRAFGGVEGGPDAVIDAFLEAGNTLMAPTFSNSFLVPPPSDDRPPRNGIDYDSMTFEAHDRVYDPETNAIDRETMGAIPAALLQRPGRRRGNHPTHSFTALGPQADRLVAPQSRERIYGALQALVEADGLIVLIGVGLNRMTLLHSAEQAADRRPFVRWVNTASGDVVRTTVGFCSRGFDKLDPLLLPFMKRDRIGSGECLFGSAATVYTAALAAMRANPDITRCSESCIRCDDAIQGGPPAAV